MQAGALIISTDPEDDPKSCAIALKYSVEYYEERTEVAAEVSLSRSASALSNNAITTLLNTNWSLSLPEADSRRHASWWV